MTSRSPWSVSGLVLLANVVAGLGCSTGDSEPIESVSPVRLRFPEHAAEVLAQSERFHATDRGFVVQEAPDRGRWRSIDIVVPKHGSEAIELRTRRGTEIRVREVGAKGISVIEENAVAYERTGGRSYWASAGGGVEEWIHFDAGHAFGDRVAASWEIEGASVRANGDEIELVDDEGAALVRVAAPAAYAKGGASVPVWLAARDHAIDLFVDAGGAEVLVDPSWTSAGTMVAARMMHAAATLADGRVIVAGGTNDVFSLFALGTSEIYNPTLNTWSSGPAFNGVYGHTMTTLHNGKVLSVGGANSSGGSPGTVQIYDPALNTWAPAASTPTGFTRHTATLMPDGTVLVTGGSAGFGGSAVRTVYSYNPASGTWTTKANMIGTRYTHTATLLGNGKVLVAGGTTGGAGLRTAELYDPAANTWTALPLMAVGRYMHTATVLANGKVLMASGATSLFGSDTATCTVFDPSTNTWATTGAVAQLRDTHVAMRLGSGKVLIAGGENGATGNGYATSEIYDPAVGTWSAGPPMAAGHAYTAGAVLPAGLLVAGGGTDIFTLNQVAELFTDLLGNGAPCSSGSECASGFCADGVCCNTACSAGSCDACSVAAGAAVDGTCALLTGPTCDDGNACTQRDACESGVCVGSVPVSCVPSDACHLAGTCNPADGQCSNPVAPDGTACDDSCSCTQGDTCQSGICTTGTLSTSGACAPICATVQRGTSGNVEDAHIASDKPAKSYGASASLAAGDVGGGERQALIRWDLSFVPSDAIVTSATASLTVLLYGGVSSSVHRVLAPWSEATVTFGTFGNAFSPLVEATCPGTAVTSADLAALAQGWVSGAVPNYGVLVEATGSGLTVFHSSESSPVSARPALDLCYVPCH